MRILIGHLRERGWEGVWYVTLLIILPAFVGIPTVLWLASHPQRSGF